MRWSKILNLEYYSKYLADVMTEEDRERIINEDEVKRIVEEILADRRNVKMCLGFIVLVAYGYINMMIWGYGGIAGFLLQQPMDLYFHAYLQLAIILNLIFGLIILVIIWIIK